MMTKQVFDIKTYTYDLPEKLIAQYPLTRRENARLLVVDRKAGTITHDVFKNVDTYLPPQSVFVLNESKVIHARLKGKKVPTGANVEIFLLNRLADGYSYEVLMKPMKRLKNGDKVSIAGGKLVAEIVDKDARIVRFNRKNILSVLEKIGHIPLPPYIKRNDKALDRKYYQTVYADKPGSVAAPTAGLHFTNPLINRLKRVGHDFLKVSLHINYGTFKAVETDDIRQHHMHREEYSVTSAVYERLKKYRKEKRLVVAVGTTSCRTLETLARKRKLSGATDLFIYPGFEFKYVDALLTNFHLPASTLLMLVSAFGGVNLIHRAYTEAIRERYRFYSYGDAMLVI